MSGVMVVMHDMVEASFLAHLSGIHHCLTMLQSTAIQSARDLSLLQRPQASGLGPGPHRFPAIAFILAPPPKNISSFFLSLSLFRSPDLDSAPGVFFRYFSIIFDSSTSHITRGACPRGII